MKIKIPREIRVGAHKYKVVYWPDLGVDENLCGVSRHRKTVIGVDPVYNPTQQVQILLHETLHAIDRIYGCELSEGNIDRIAEGLTDVLVDSFDVEFDWSDITSDSKTP